MSDIAFKRCKKKKVLPAITHFILKIQTVQLFKELFFIVQISRNIQPPFQCREDSFVSERNIVPPGFGEVEKIKNSMITQL